MQTGFKPYKKDFDYSYALGAFPTIELLKSHPEKAIKVLVSSAYKENGDVDLAGICAEKSIPMEYADRQVERLSPKENCFVIGVFSKYTCSLVNEKPHVALVNPGNMGNLGTIIRTMLGFGVKDLAIIGGGASILDPKAVRASMGAVFGIRFAYFDSIGTYSAEFGGRELYPFMLDGELELDGMPSMGDGPYTLIFGNEATGLDESYRSIGKSVVIKHSHDIDSLNLSIAVGIALYEFSKRSKKMI